MSRPQSPFVAVLRGIGRAAVTIVVVAYTILDELVFPLLRPLIDWLGHLRLFERLGALIGRLPPYVVLVLFAVPFVFIEPVKVFALYWGAVGHPIQGLVILSFAQVASILVCERIYHAGKGQLLRIGWFARLMGWLVRLRDRALGWVKSTAAFQAAVAMVRSIRAWFRGVIAALR